MYRKFVVFIRKALIRITTIRWECIVVRRCCIVSIRRCCGSSSFHLRVRMFSWSNFIVCMRRRTNTSIRRADIVGLTNRTVLRDTGQLFHARRCCEKWEKTHWLVIQFGCWGKNENYYYDCVLAASRPLCHQRLRTDRTIPYHQLGALILVYREDFDVVQYWTY